MLAAQWHSHNKFYGAKHSPSSFSSSSEGSKVENRPKPQEREISNFKPHGVSSEINSSLMPECVCPYVSKELNRGLIVMINQDLKSSGPETGQKMMSFLMENHDF